MADPAVDNRNDKIHLRKISPRGDATSIPSPESTLWKTTEILVQLTIPQASRTALANPGKTQVSLNYDNRLLQHEMKRASWQEQDLTGNHAGTQYFAIDNLHRTDYAAGLPMKRTG